MIIAPPRLQDLEMLVALTEATGFFHSAEVQSVANMASEYFENPESDEYFWIVARETPDTPPLGYACYGPASHANGTYDLYWIVVDKAQQDKKIGSALLEFIEQDLNTRSARQLYIETSDKPQYAPTRAFYERRGYTLVAHFRDYYEVGDGKVVYLKAFGQKKS
jgi:ribosomal protein S18 acetylase RimI-like enzyme